MMDDELIRRGQEALREESSALLVTADRLDARFAQAVKLMQASTGKVVVCGLGKSGHVGRKIASTLASTGTAAFFLHPSEALHGDLGMLQSHDVLLVIAFGGETRETLEVAKFANRRRIPVLALTGKPQSSLAKIADVTLDGSVAREACPLNLAPTSSTTVAMAIGDALAIALMHARGFQEKDFARYHPDGSLGRQLSLVRDHMRSDLAPLALVDSFDRVIEVITAQNYGIAGVFDQAGHLLGAITDGDLRRALKGTREQVFGMDAQAL
ncbi:MAG: KpsF/GutQ family sugar-phosphate isomerase, partial [Proteobacteria bacterium]|nr:KpsF/GutQ family sugar-phosphate isomerase [Pseudomonadota bacterium]